MLISHKYKFIFVKTTKTAGTSIEVDLSRIMGAEDVVTEIFPPVQGHEPRNYINNGSKAYNHMPAREILSFIGSESYYKYFKFCVEREPVDKCISHYSMITRSPLHNTKTADLTWEQYLSKRSLPVDFDKYSYYSGSVIVDRILHYETLDTDLLSLMQSLGVPFFGLTSRAKSGFRRDDISLDRVSRQQKEVIYESFAESEVFTGYHLV